MRKIPVPANRYTPLKENWMKIFTPIVEHLGLQIRFNLKSRNVEIRVSTPGMSQSARFSVLLKRQSLSQWARFVWTPESVASVKVFPLQG